MRVFPLLCKCPGFCYLLSTHFFRNFWQNFIYIRLYIPTAIKFLQ